MKENKLWYLNNDSFSLNRIFLSGSLKNFLSNAEYGLCIDQNGAGYSVTLDKDTAGGRLFVSHHGYSVAKKGRFVYCLDKSEGVLWSPSFVPVYENLDSYSCVHGIGSTSITGSKNGITIESTHFIPEYGRFELWQISVQNTSLQTKKLTLYTSVEFLLQSSYAVDSPYYSWYTDSLYDTDCALISIIGKKPLEKSVYGFCRSLVKPSGYETSLQTFIGSGHIGRPEACFSESATCGENGGDIPIAAFRYDIVLEPGEKWVVDQCIGEGESAAKDAIFRFKNSVDVNAELSRVTEKNRKSLLPSYVSTREEYTKTNKLSSNSFLTLEERSWFNVFLPVQIRQQSLGMIRFTYKGYRDVAQDIMGLCHYDLDSACMLLLELCGMQHADGRCLRQANMNGGPHDERDFRDLPFWLVLAVSRYFLAGGDTSILREKKKYLEGGESYTFVDHMVRGVKYVLNYGSHGLLEIGVGDWNDALSSFGKGGESLWLNQIAYLAISCLENFPLTQNERDLFGFDFAKEKEKLLAGVLAGWNGSWFLRGYTENGSPVGGKERIFLLPQAWFTISGMATLEPKLAKMAETALDSMVEKLGHEDGFLKCFPAFTEYDPQVGNLSALTPGVAENFAVYNHASAFGIDALFLAGRETEALQYLRKILPFYKDLSKTLVEPYVLTNYYNGGFYPHLKGRGGISWLTGTANWLALIDFDFLREETKTISCDCNFF